MIAVLKIDEKWSISYDTEKNDSPVEILRYGNSGNYGSLDNWSNFEYAMFYALLKSKKSIDNSPESV